MSAEDKPASPWDSAPDPWAPDKTADAAAAAALRVNEQAAHLAAEAQQYSWQLDPQAAQGDGGQTPMVLAPRVLEGVSPLRPGQRPSVGRDVHYVSYGTPGGEYKSVCRTAKITEVGAWVTEAEQDNEVAWDDERGGNVRRRKLVQRWDAEAVALVVFNPTGQFFHPCIEHHAGDIGTVDGSPVAALSHRPGTWHWPERVGP